MTEFEHWRITRAFLSFGWVLDGDRYLLIYVDSKNLEAVTGAGFDLGGFTFGYLMCRESEGRFVVVREVAPDEYWRTARMVGEGRPLWGRSGVSCWQFALKRYSKSIHKELEQREKIA